MQMLKLSLLALIVSPLVAFAAPLTRSIDCHQQGDGFNDFTLQITDATHATLTVDVFHTPVGKLISGMPPGTRLARFTLTSREGFGLSATDPLLATFIAEPTQVEFLDPWKKVLGSIPGAVLIDVRLNAIHGKAALGGAGTFTDADTVLYEVQVSRLPTATTRFKTVVGRHWLMLDVIQCTTK